MRRGKPTKVDPSAGDQVADATNNQPPLGKRARKDNEASASYDKLLAKNKFASLPLHAADPVQQIKKKVKLPPVFTTTREVAALQTELAAKQIFPLFKLCSQGTKIICSTEVDYQAVVTFLEVKKLEFYTHDPPGSKPLKVIIRGLPEKAPAAIIEELKAAKLKPLNVFPIRRQEGDFRDKLYLAHLEKGSVTMTELQRIKALFSIVVEWQRYRPKKRDVTQCGNCLAFGHGTKNCHMRPKCSKCAGSHASETCEPMVEGTDPKCVNCGANHEGSNRACPKRAEYLEIRRKASAKNQRERRQVPPPPPANEEHFPRLPYKVPNLPPLETNRRRETLPPPSSVQHRFAAAAAAGQFDRNPPPPPPGWGNLGRSENINQPSGDGSLYSSEEITELTLGLYRRLRSCRTKEEQIKAASSAVMDFLDKYGP